MRELKLGGGGGWGLGGLGLRASGVEALGFLGCSRTPGPDALFRCLWAGLGHF